MTKTYEPRVGPKWVAEATRAIIALSATRAYHAPLTEPHCGEWTPPGLVTRKFHFEGKGRNVIVIVKCHAKMMVALFKLLRKNPTFQVAGSLASYRSYGTQYRLWYAWTHHLPGSHLAANPCYGYHRCGRALDGYMVSEKERRDFLSIRVGGRQVYDLMPQDPPHFSFGARS